MPHSISDRSPTRPRMQASDARPPSSPRWPSARVASTRAPRILVAEDDAEMRALVVEALEADGYDVTAVATGTNLLAHVETILFGHWETGTIKLVICDDRMPGCRGLHIIEGLRALDPNTSVILMTGFGDDAIRTRVEEVGGIFLDKPFSIADLLHTVHQLVPIERRR